MAKRRIWKRLLWLLGFFVLALVAIVLTSPFWVPPLIERGAGQFDVHYEKFERLEDGRFAIHNLVRTNENFDLEIKKIEGFRPIEWYQRVRGGETNEIPSFITVDGWRLVIHDAPKEEDEPEPDKPDRGIHDYYDLAEKYIEHARKWVPRALLLNGVVEFPDRHVTFATITWEEGRLEASGTWPRNAIPLVIKARLTEEQPYQLSFAMHPLDFRTRLRVAETNQNLHAELVTFYKEARADVNAEFGPEGLIPLTASLESRDFKLPADLLKLEGYRELTGDLSGQWVSNSYTLNLEARAEPLSSATNLPPVDMALAVEGNTNQLSIEKLHSTAPGLQVSASAPIKLNYQGVVVSEESTLQLTVELEKLPWLDLKGRVDATLQLEPGNRFPRVNLRAEGTGLGFRKIEASSLTLQARLQWPMIEELQGGIAFGGNGAIQFTASGNLETREIRQAELQADGLIALEALPPEMAYDSIALHVQASGPMTNLQHQGKVRLRGLQAPQIRPLNLDLQWRATQAAFEELALLARAGPASLFLGGTGGVDVTSTNLVVRELRLSKGEETYLDLVAPFQVSLLSTNSGSRTGPAIEITPFRWQGEDRSVDFAAWLAWPDAGRLSFAATNVNPDLFQHFVTRSLSGLELARLDLNASWDQGPLRASVSGEFSAVQEPFDRLSAQVRAEMDSSGLSITDLLVAGTNGPIVTARGFLPLSVHPLDSVKPVRLSTRENLDFHLRTAPNEMFWGRIAALAKVDLEAPFVSFDITGTTRKPTGQLDFRLASVQLLQTNQPLPRVEEIEGSIVLNEQILRIPGIRLQLEDQPLLLVTETTLSPGFWEMRPEEIQTYLLTNSSARLRAPNFDVAPFVRFVPEHLAPQGSLDIDAGINPGLSLSGAILATNIRTRPIPKIGVLENISANIQLRDQELRIEELGAVIGGEKLLVTGTLDLAREHLERGVPGLELAIRGTNVPLARNPDVILRSDLDLRISNATNNPPIISGVVNLQDSVLLQDIATLVPGRVTSPSRRPPYFSIEQEPINDWVLDLRVRGVDFMRVRSPFFQGQVSATFHVTGDLEEPMALGEATITSGRVIFPFATLQVDQAIVSLTRASPYLPHVFTVARGRVFGYDITMQAEGPADEPVIEFSSVPPLTSEEIVLLLTTGQIPRSDFGFTNEQRAGRLALFVGKSLWQKLNPGSGDEERLTIRSGEDVSEEGKQTYSVEYKLTDDWALVGEYDRFGAVNAGVKWKVYSR